MKFAFPDPYGGSNPEGSAQYFGTLIPFILVLVIPGFLQIGQRFVLQQIVDEKTTKMRETLRILSLSQFNYAFSFFVT